MTYEYWILISLSCTSFSRCDWGFRTSLLITVQWNTKSDFSFLGNIKFQTAYQLHYRIHERKKSETTCEAFRSSLAQGNYRIQWDDTSNTHARWSLQVIKLPQKTPTVCINIVKHLFTWTHNNMTSKFPKKWQLFWKSFPWNTCCHGLTLFTLRLTPMPSDLHWTPNIFFCHLSAIYSKGTSHARQYLNLTLRQNQHLNNVIGILKVSTISKVLYTILNLIRPGFKTFVHVKVITIHFLAFHCYHEEYMEISLTAGCHSSTTGLTLFYNSPLQTQTTLLERN